jgi:hypothetical protein
MRGGKLEEDVRHVIVRTSITSGQIGKHETAESKVALHEQAGSRDKASDLHSRPDRLEFLSVHRISRHVFFVAFLCTSRQMPG